MLALGVTLPGYTLATPCADEASSALERGEWRLASQLYARAADEPACVGDRQSLLWSAATTNKHTLAGATDLDRCAAGELFDAVVDARPTTDLAERARTERDALAVYCEVARPPSPTTLIKDAMPPLDPNAALTRDDDLDVSDAVVLGAASVAAVGATVAYAVLWMADDARDEARRQASSATDVTAYARAKDAFDEADDRAFASGVTAYSLLGVSLTLAGTWALQQVFEPEETERVMQVSANRVGE